MSLCELRAKIEIAFKSIQLPPMRTAGEEWLPLLLEVACNVFHDLSSNYQTGILTDSIFRSSIYLVLKDKGEDLLVDAISIFIEKSLLRWSSEHKFDREGVNRLRILNLTAIYFDKTISSLTKAAVQHIGELCNGTYDTTFMDEINSWVEEKLLPFCDLLFPADIVLSKSLVTRLPLLIKSTFVDIRTQELFEIIADFPDSTEALRELHTIATEVDAMARVGKTLRGILKRRLLHVGASTNQVIEMYVTIIRSLRILDPSNLLLNYVAQPVRKYLVNRPDTVRCIVSSITDGKDLHGELRVGGTLEYGLDSDDEGDAPDENWYPAKRGPELPTSGGKERDILAILVSIYGSTDMFVAEYRSILADKLLQNLQYGSDQEVATLELLKIRFGEEALHSCEVMMHDLEGSRRVNLAVAEQMRLSTTNNADGVAIDCILVSSYYWPSLQPQTVTHHSVVAGRIEKFCEAFAIVRKPRSLEVAPQLGIVQLELEFDDGTIREYSVAPVQASLILFVSENGSISLGGLAQLCDTSPEDVRQRMGFWISRRVVREICPLGCALDDIVYEVIESQAMYNEDSVIDAFHDSEYVASSVSAGADETLAFASYVSIIRGMLSNQETVSIERIHTMLKMVASSSSGDMRFDMNMVQFKKFLATLVTADTLELVDDNSYRLRR